MAPKQMKIVQQTNEKIVFRGFGHDNMGSSFSDYGLTISIKSGKIDKCKLHMHDRNVDIEYLKANEKPQDVLNSNTDDFEVFINFIQKWNLEISRDLKYAIAKKTDELTNIGVDFYEEGDIENAINFYNQALSVMPINDDALKNLKICYSETNNILKYNEVKKKLDYLNKLGL
jgi:tetratricopeptide (TPR) repeat protein